MENNELRKTVMEYILKTIQNGLLLSSSNIILGTMMEKTDFLSEDREKREEALNSLIEQLEKKYPNETMEQWCRRLKFRTDRTRSEGANFMGLIKVLSFLCTKDGVSISDKVCADNSIVLTYKPEEQERSMTFTFPGHIYYQNNSDTIDPHNDLSINLKTRNKKLKDDNTIGIDDIVIDMEQTLRQLQKNESPNKKYLINILLGAFPELNIVIDRIDEWTIEHDISSKSLIQALIDDNKGLTNATAYQKVEEYDLKNELGLFLGISSEEFKEADDYINALLKDAELVISM